MRYLITFSYDGTEFYGYQKQPNLRTVEGEIEKALKFISGGEDIIIESSGRTDRGVHALNQKAHFDLNKDITLYKLKCALNTYTSNDIYIKNVEIVDSEFHSRYMVKEKTYIYKLNIGEYNPIERNYVFQYCKDLDIEKIMSESKYLIGEHDFSSFINKDEEHNSYVRNIYSIDISLNDNIIIFKFVGNGFLKYQIRNMVGALIECCTKNISIKKVLESKDRCSFGKIAPPEGLYLYDVKY